VAFLLAPAACAGSSTLNGAAELRAREIEGLASRLLIEGSAPNGQIDHFAVLIGANTELRHRGNLSMAYQILIEQGYSRDDVYILESEGDATFFPTTDLATRATITRVFDHLRKVVEPHDTLLIYVTGHGRRITATFEENGQATTLGVSTMVLNREEELADWELAAMLDGINPSVGIAFFDQCYGAIFATITKSCNFVFITAAAEDETSYGVSFPRAFWSAFRAPRLDATATSVLEAYNHAIRADRGTLMGMNQPQLVHTCVDPAKLTLLGLPRESPTVLSANGPVTGAILDNTDP
jgi:hypothetical protein